MKLGEMTAATDLYFLQEYGDATSINGVSIGADGVTPLKSFWDLAQPSRVSAFLSEQDFGRAAYEVKLPPYVYDAPFNLKSGSRIINIQEGWVCAVRMLDPMGTQNMRGLVNVLVVLGAK